MNINILKKGDEVIAINDKIVAIKRKNGQVDIFSIMYGEKEIYVDPVKIATIGYGNGEISKVIDEDGTTVMEF